MFSRRHPFLYFTLVFCAIFCTTILGITTIVFLGMRDAGLESGEKVGIVEIDGMIADSREVIDDLKRFRKDESIRAIVLRIDSPGGVVGPSQEIYREVQKTVAEKTVIASMGSIAASGGYYVAAASQGIVANPGTITGSIGVIIGYTNFRSLLDKIGLTPVVIKSGEYKDLGSPIRPMTDEEREILQRFVSETHAQFVRAVVEGRKMEQERVETLADGRIYTGEQAFKLGLVDRLGNLDDAVKWAAEMGGIKGEVETVWAREEKFSLKQWLTENLSQVLLRAAADRGIFAGYIHSP